MSCGWMPRPTESAPCGSKSTSSVRRPCSAIAAPRLMVVVVLPTPPFWLQTATMRAGPCEASGSGSGKAGSGRPVGPISPGRSSITRDAATSKTLPGLERRELFGTLGLPSGRCKPTRRKRRIFAGYRPTESTGMRGGIDLSELVDRHQSVDLRGRHRGVSEQFLDHPDVRAAVKQMGRERVPQGVR